MTTATVTWIDAATTPAPFLEEILLAVRGEENEATTGYRLPRGGFRVMDGHVLAATEIYAWARMPKSPRAVILTRREPKSPHHCPRCGKLKLTRKGAPHTCIA